ncbi:hypothetical protein KAX03_01120 [Candidatus Bathyarchaeota archaeon]|nr:hypothetical protein [Candidatus Bathyarchaeota archaeon]
MKGGGSIKITKALEQWNGKNDSIIKTIKKTLWPSKRSMKEKMPKIIHKLDVQLKKLQQISSKLKVRDQEFFKKCVDAQVSNDRFRAVMYANECAEIRKMAQIVLTSELTIEKAVIRFQTIGELDDVLFAISPIASIIQDIQGKLVGVIPSVANRLQEVNIMLSEAMEKTGNINPTISQIQSSNEEATEILNEANRIAELKIQEKFPELPKEIALQSISEQKEGPIALSIGSNFIQKKMSSFDKKVFEYLKEHDGRISILQCASNLKVAPADVEKVILKLREEGKVSIE